jgi:hypothetical protein
MSCVRVYVEFERHCLKKPCVEKICRGRLVCAYLLILEEQIIISNILSAVKEFQKYPENEFLFSKMESNGLYTESVKLCYIYLLKSPLMSVKSIALSSVS